MQAEKDIALVPEMHPVPRVRVFRRTLTAIEDFEGMQVDAYVIVSERYVVVFDTMLCPEDAQFMVESVQDELAGRTLLVVNSHADWDHVWGNGYFTGEHAAPIIAHDYALVRMGSEEARAGLADYQGRYPLFRNVKLTPPTLTFSQCLTIDGGDLTFKLFPAPGHHADHIAAWIPEPSLLLAFDALEDPLPVIENAEAVSSMFATLESFLALQPQHILCSHGKTSDPGLINKNLEYLREVKRRGYLFLQEHHPSETELEQAATLIGYPLDEVIAGSSEPVDRTFYNWAHNQNVRSILQWLMQ